MLNKQEKTKIIKEFAPKSNDTGSPEVQIALITRRLDYLAQHFASHKNDHHSKTGLMKLVGRRKRLLGYLKNQDPSRYEILIKELNIRK